MLDKQTQLNVALSTLMVDDNRYGWTGTITKVRAIDTQTEHFTYIILITAKDGNNALNEAFDNGIDDFVNKDQLNEQLLTRIRAADRVTRLYKDLLKKNGTLKGISKNCLFTR